MLCCPPPLAKIPVIECRDPASNELTFLILTGKTGQPAIDASGVSHLAPRGWTAHILSL